MKLWIKIVLLNILIVVSLGNLIGLTVNSLVTDSMREELTRQGKSLARNLSDRVADSILLSDFYKTQDAIEDAFRTEDDVEYIFVTNKNGYVFAHTFNDGYPSDLLRWNPVVNEPISIQLLDTEKGYIRDVGVKVFEGMVPELHIGIKESRISKTLGSIRKTIATLTVIVILIGSVSSIFLSRLITKPLNRLVGFTHNLSKGEFGGKVSISSRDEVGELAETFNNLSQELKLYRERMEESYKQMLRSEKLTALGRLSAGLAHEIRNPLTSIKVLFQAFKDNPGLTKDDMEVVLSEIGQMDEILARFLSFARTDEFNLTDTDVNEVIRKVVQLSKYEIKIHSINAVLELGNLPSMRADRTMLEQAFLNLMINAMEAMPDGGTLTISSKLKNSKAVISVRDTGKGISSDIRDRLFDPFFTTKADGTGLGLSIVYNIVKAHNGDINFRSNGHGTTFTIEIPITDERRQ